MHLNSRKIFQLLFAVNLLSGIAYSQGKSYQLQGYVSDNENQMPLPGASVYSATSQTSVLTNEKGFFSFEIPGGKHTLIFTFIGYTTDSIVVNIEGNLSLSIKLSPTEITLDEVIVSDEKSDKTLNQTETGLITIRKKDIERFPYLFGEIDPIRIIQLMPGVQTSGEGNTGYYVRGGAVDQNLMLLDNSIVYNPSHLFGFFSIFNGATVSGIDLYKGGVPSNLGGRLSSVTKVNTRKGDMKKFKGEGSIGLIATNILVEGPIKKDKGSFLIAARRTYIDFLSGTLQKLSILKQDINYYFYDLNVNLDYTFSTRNTFSFRSYFGKDDFKYATGSGFGNAIAWRNRTTSLSWRHLYRNLSTDLSITASGYDMSFGAAINNYSFKIKSNIRDAAVNYSFAIQMNKHDLTWGVNYINHSLKPNNITASSEDVDLSTSPAITLHGHEAAIFFNDKISINDKLEVSGGIRLSAYAQAGSFTRFIEDGDFQILDTIKYKKNTLINRYVNPEPRLAIRYSLTSNSSIKVSFDKTNQYMHMAPLSSVSLPLDIWVPSSDRIKPQYARQYSIGYFRNFLNNAVESSVVLYYKKMGNQIEYRQGVIIGYSKGFNFDDNFVFGKGTSYGSEFSIKKSGGRINGLISYTLSRTTREFPELNNGRSFPAKYDRLHDLSTLVNFVYRPKWTVSGVFVYATGNALNLPIARYVIQGNVINEYGARNSFRMPAYHRMDLAVTYTSHKSTRYESYWTLSIYNLYSRKNPYYMYFETEGNLKNYELRTNIKQVSLFPIIPAITYRIKF